ncbi:hypothetical protein [Pontibacter beigongshangensis]|uniref:hypothetical protein n=1 Tax=Pontibacter beigongshangensis TaxID=2574733 RepID=UPI00164FC492|nr:hypothetical protein [Pontibacter beigongshangensis]
MHYEEEDHRNHQERWQQGSRNRRPRPDNEEHFNDFSSRWNEPVPPLHRYRHEELDERKRFKNDGDNWDQQRPHPTRRQQADQQRDQYEQWYENRYRQQRDPRQQRQEDNYNRHHQYPSDRWQQDDFIVREEELRRRYNRQFRDWEEEDHRRSRH